MFGVNGSGDTSGYGRLVREVTLPGSSPRPYGGYFDEIVDRLAEALKARRRRIRRRVEKVVVYRDELTLHVRRELLPQVAQRLRDEPELRFELCLGVNGVHYPHETGRELHAVYPLKSITHNRRVRLEVAAPDGDPHIPSLFAVYPTNDWHERETYDFFGIIFDGHPSLTRIEMPDDWHGTSAAQGLPTRRHPGRIQGRADTSARRAEGATTDERNHRVDARRWRRDGARRRRPGLGQIVEAARDARAR